MNLTFEPYSSADEVALIEWLSSDSWTFHVHPHLSGEQVRKWIDAGVFPGEDSNTFWVLVDGSERIGLMQITDFQDQTPSKCSRHIQRRRERQVCGSRRMCITATIKT